VTTTVATITGAIRGFLGSSEKRSRRRLVSVLRSSQEWEGWRESSFRKYLAEDEEFKSSSPLVRLSFVIPCLVALRLLVSLALRVWQLLRLLVR